MGRPTIDDSKRKQVMTLRMEQGERAEIKAAAKRQGVKPSTWAREALLAAARKSR
jgi:hypothetical protein